LTFYQRYIELCEDQGKVPCSQFMADALGVQKATITLWGRNGNIPKGDTLSKMADIFGVSTDYLLLRTDDPTPPNNKEALDAATRRTIAKIQRLDAADRARIETLLDGMLMTTKYEDA